MCSSDLMFWRNFTVRFDGATIGHIESSAELRQGQAFVLPDGSRVEIRLDQGLGKADLLVLRDGQPLPGSAGDPRQQVAVASNMLFIIAAFNALVGLVAIVTDSSVFASLGLGWPSLVVAAVYAGLGYAVRRWRSRVALALGIGLFAIDGLLSFALSIGSGGRPATGIFVRIFLLLPMIRAWPYLAKVQEEERQTGPDLPGGDDPKNPWQVTRR